MAFGRLLAGVGLIFCLAVAGCGGGGGSSTTGTGGGGGTGGTGGSGGTGGTGGSGGVATGIAKVSVVWAGPGGSVNMPEAAQSATIELVGTDTDDTSTLIVNPTNSYSFAVAPGTYTYHVNAYSGAAIAGAVVGAGSGVMTITSNQTTAVTASLKSTVAQVFVTAPASVNVGETPPATMTLAGIDSLPQNVSISGDLATWSSSDNTIATVDAHGLTPVVTAHKAGFVTITAVYADPSLVGGPLTSSALLTVTNTGSVGVGVN